MGQRHPAAILPPVVGRMLEHRYSEAACAKVLGGMIELPGDFTPPSRFIRAVAFTATARKTPDGPETTYEMFRILDNFNVPLGATVGGIKRKWAIPGCPHGTFMGVAPT